MTELTATTTNVVSTPPGRLSYQVASAVQTYGGGLAAMRGPGHATTQGFLDALNDEVGHIPLGGFFSDEVLGAATLLKNNVDVRDKILRRHAVVGTTAKTDWGEKVYASDDNILTITKPAANALPIGIVWDWHTGTTCDVYLFGFANLCGISLGGGAKATIYLGSISFSGFADANMLTGIVLSGHGKILELYTITEEALVGSGGTGLVNGEIGGTDITGGVVTVATATQATQGAKSAGTAITALNRFHDGDLLDIEVASSSGTLTSGRVGVYAVVGYELGY